MSPVIDYAEALERQLFITWIYLPYEKAILDDFQRALDSYKRRKQRLYDFAEIDHAQMPQPQLKPDSKVPLESLEEKALSHAFIRYASHILPSSDLAWITTRSTNPHDTYMSWIQHHISLIDRLYANDDSEMIFQLLCCYAYAVLAELEHTLGSLHPAPESIADIMTSCVNVATGRTLCYAYTAYQNETNGCLEGGWDSVEIVVLRTIGMLDDGSAGGSQQMDLRDFRDRYVVRWKAAKEALETLEGEYATEIRQGMLTMEDTWLSGMRSLYQDLRIGRFPTSVTHILGLLLLTWTMDSGNTTGSTTLHVQPVSEAFLSGVWEMAILDTNRVVALVADVLWPQWRNYGVTVPTAGFNRETWKWIDLSDASDPLAKQKNSFSTSRVLLQRILLHQKGEQMESRYPYLDGSRPDILGFQKDLSKDLSLEYPNNYHMGFQDDPRRYASVPTTGFQFFQGTATDRLQRPTRNGRDSRELILVAMIESFITDLKNTAKSFMYVCALASKLSAASILADSLKRFVLDDLDASVPVSIFDTAIISATQGLFCAVNSGFCSLEQIAITVNDIVHSRRPSDVYKARIAAKMRAWMDHVHALGVGSVEYADAVVPPTPSYNTGCHPAADLDTPAFYSPSAPSEAWRIQTHALDAEIPFEFHSITGLSAPNKSELSTIGSKKVHNEASDSRLAYLQEVNCYALSPAVRQPEIVHSPSYEPPQIVKPTYRSFARQPASYFASRRNRRKASRSPSIPTISSTQKLPPNKQRRSSPATRTPIKRDASSINLEASPFILSSLPIPTPTPTPPMRSHSRSMIPWERSSSISCTVSGCAALLGNKSLLARHLKGTHGVKMKCEHCGKMIGNRADYLKKHARVCKMRPTGATTHFE